MVLCTPLSTSCVVVINQSSNIHQNTKKQVSFPGIPKYNGCLYSITCHHFTGKRKLTLVLYIFCDCLKSGVRIMDALCLICFSYAPARVQCSLQHRPCLWCPGGPRWWVRAREWESHARQQFQLITSQTWVRGSLWICFFWVLSHFPLVLCWFLMPLSLLHLGEFD